MIFSWPCQIPSGEIYDDLVSSTDIAPTIFDYVGIEALPEQQGLSLRRRIEGGPASGRNEIIGLDERSGHFLRTGSWRYLRFARDGREELYICGAAGQTGQLAISVDNKFRVQPDLQQPFAPFRDAEEMGAVFLQLDHCRYFFSRKIPSIQKNFK